MALLCCPDESVWTVQFFRGVKGFWGFPGGASGKGLVCQCRRHKRHGLIPGSGRSPGGGHGNPLQSTCLENPMDRGTWWTIVHGIAESQARVSASAHTYAYMCIYGLPRWRLWYRICLSVKETQETWVRSLGREDPLEEGMATPSSIFAWRIPWAEEPGRLQSMGSQRVGHD